MTRQARHFPVLRFLALVALAISGAACEGSQDSDTTGGSPMVDRAAFVVELKKAGHSVELKGPVVQPFLSIQGQFVSIDGGDVQIFEYGSEKAVKAVLVNISPDGSTVGNTRIGWVEPPHFFTKGKLLVLYVGSNQKVKQALESVLGPQAAGE